MTRCVIYFHGPPGVGKSRLLEEIGRKQYYLPRESTLVLTLDLQTLAASKASVHDALSEASQGLKKIIESQLTPVVILDDSDTLAHHPSLRSPVEDLVEEAIPKGLVICAGRNQVAPLGRLSIKRFIELHPLNNLSRTEAAHQVETIPMAADFIYSYTFGHPGATVALAQSLTDYGLNLKTVRQAELASFPKSDSFEQGLIGLRANLFQEVPAELLSLAKAAPVLRRFNAELLRFLAESLDYQEKGKPYKDYLDIIQTLQKTGLVYWDSPAISYAFAPQLAPLLRQVLGFLDPDLYYEAHQTSFQFQITHLQGEALRTPHRYLADLLYYAAITAEHSPQETEKQLANWWEKRSHWAGAMDQFSWERLVQVLETDPNLMVLAKADDTSRSVKHYLAQLKNFPRAREQ